MALTDHFQRGFIKKVESRCRTEMDLLSDQTARLNIWLDTDTNLDLVDSKSRLAGFHKNLCFTKYSPPRPQKMGWEKKREKSDAFLIYCVCEGWGAWFFSFSRIMAGSQLFYTSEIQFSEYLFVNTTATTNNKKLLTKFKLVHYIFFQCF